MKNLILFSLLLSSSLSFLAQSTEEVQQLITRGIEYHDSGQFEEAISTYQEALDIDHTNATANYEIAFSYASLRDYDNAIKHCNKVIKQKKGDPTMAYVTKANCLDKQGYSKKAIKVYKKALKKTGHHYLIHYNLALTYFKLKDFDKSIENTIAAIENNPGHASSHILLGYSQMSLGNKTQTILALNYFLLLEHDTKRSAEALKIFNDKIIGDVTSSQDGNNKTINISISPNTDEGFMAAELSLSILQATKGTLLDGAEEDEIETEMSDQEYYVYKITSFYQILGELKEAKNEGLFWDFYVPMFYKIANSDHMETFCYLFSSNDEESAIWIEENEDALIDFAEWLQNGQ
jgi:tetratricopeptide (TPR) repeat protein